MKNRSLGVLIGLVVILLVFGAVSAGVLPKIPVLVQSSDPNASVLEATSEQANQLFFFVVFVLVNLVGAGGTLAVLFWFLSRGVNHAYNSPNNPVPMLNRDRQLPTSNETPKLPDSAA